MIDDVLNHGYERFLLHYNFPPFSTGEAKATRGVGRREIGHGNLAHRALKRMIPDNYPYVVRVISDILESNGSSSMATVCAGTLALRDAGVPMKKPVSGIAMGLISENKGTNYAILSDILGDEDHLGDMDFKVTGTKDGITATQMDIKVDGLSYEILENALAQAKEGRMHILGKILEAQPEAREDLKPHAPRIETMIIGKEFIGAVIGPGGKIIQGIQEKTGATVSIDEVDGVGRSRSPARIRLRSTRLSRRSRLSSLFLRSERFMKERFPLSCLMVHSLSSCRVRMVCFTFPRSIGNVWRPLSKPA